MSILLILCLCNAFSFRTPPPALSKGATYTGTVRVLALPTQFVSIQVIDDGFAFLRLSGVLNAEGNIEFSMLAEDEVKFDFGEEVREKLDKRFCVIEHARYDREEDSATVRVSIAPLRVRKTVKLRRSPR